MVIDLLAISSPVEFYSKFTDASGSLLHIGAHEGEEQNAYSKMGFVEILWVEAQPDKFAKLVSKIDPRFCLQAAVWSERSRLLLNISNNSVSSSLLEFNAITPWKGVITSKRIELETLTLHDVVDEFTRRQLLPQKFFLVLDIQGAEFEVLRGLRSVSKNIYAISCEVSVKQTYKNGPRRRQIIWLLLRNRYIPLCSFLTKDYGHGDQLFVKLGIIRNPKLILMSILRTSLLIMIRIRKNFQGVL